MKTATPALEKFRILVIDDNPSIHKDFRKILEPAKSELKSDLDEFEASLFGASTEPRPGVAFEIDSALQGQEGLEKVRMAAAEGRPYAVAFVDVRMPPGWDGIETITHIWKEFPDLQIIICTAYSDYSWDEIARAIGNTDHVLVLKKPFDNVEVMQMAHALCKKWELNRIAARQMEELEALVKERTTELQEANKHLKNEVSERIAAEMALRHSEERFSKAFHANAVPMAIRRIDLSGYVDVNPSFAMLLGASRAEVMNGGPLDWIESDTESKILNALANHEPVRDWPAAIRTKNGETRDVLVMAQILELGEEPYQLLVMQDVTERARLENELRHAQKMEAVGRLAAGVAHDFNNILTVILGNTTMQLGRPRLDKKLAAALQQVVRAAEQATALTRQLLAYSRKQMLLRRPLALNEVIEHAVEMLGRIIGEQITVELNLGPELPPIFADATSVDQIIMNLALNARDAMPDGGRIIISSAKLDVTEADCAKKSDAKAGSFVRLSVKDNGHGMDEGTIARIFEPFFTTKEQGKGTGMGLATVYGLLKQHDGWVEVDSAPNRGTDVRVFFPITKEPVQQKREDVMGEQGSVAEPTGFTILLVEDEQMLRDFVTDALSAKGYRLLTASNGREALEVWKAHRDEINLLLTDVVMPGVPSGKQLVEQLKANKPELKVIFTSGYSPELLGSEFEQQTEHAFLAKPYRTDSLARTVAEQLCGPKAAA